MRVLCFSDLHKSVSDATRLAARAVSDDVDAMLSAGDLGIDFVHSPQLYVALAAAGKPILSVPGNHDGVVTYEGSLKLGGFTDIDGKTEPLNGFTIAGWGYRWDEPAPAGPGRREPPPSHPGLRSDPDLSRLSAKLAGADPRRTVLLSHLPPWGVRVSRTADGRDWGDRNLRKWVEAFQPAAVICGHVHLPRAQTSRVRETLIVNGGREGYLLELRAD